MRQRPTVAPALTAPRPRGPYRGRHGAECALAEAASRFAAARFGRAAFRDGRLFVERPADVPAGLLATSIFLVAAATAASCDDAQGVACLALLAAATAAAALVTFRRGRLVLAAGGDGGALALGLRRRVAVGDVARVLVVREAARAATGAKLIVVSGGGRSLVAAEVEGERAVVAAARLRALAAALAAWAGVDLCVYETPASAARLRRADRAEGLDVRGAGLRAPRGARHASPSGPTPAAPFSRPARS